MYNSEKFPLSMERECKIVTSVKVDVYCVGKTVYNFSFTQKNI